MSDIETAERVDVSFVLPLGDRVLVRPREMPKENKLGIIISTVKEKPNLGEIVAVSKPREEKEKRSRLSVGDVVVYDSRGGTEVAISEEKFVILRFSEVLAVLI